MYLHLYAYLCVSTSCSSVNSLGQWCVLQNTISTVNPVQSSSRAPTVIHFLVLLLRPPPQDRLHSVQLVHSLHVLGGGEVGFSSSGLVSLESNSSRVSSPNVNVALFRNSVDGIIQFELFENCANFFTHHILYNILLESSKELCHQNIPPYYCMSPLRHAFHQ